MSWGCKHTQTVQVDYRMFLCRQCKLVFQCDHTPFRCVDPDNIRDSCRFCHEHLPILSQKEQKTAQTTVAWATGYHHIGVMTR